MARFFMNQTLLFKLPQHPITEPFNCHLPTQNGILTTMISPKVSFVTSTYAKYFFLNSLFARGHFWAHTGLPLQIFGRQGRQSSGHFSRAPPLPLPLLFSISQNPAKDQALAALPPVAVLLLIYFIKGSMFAQILELQ